MKEGESILFLYYGRQNKKMALILGVKFRPLQVNVPFLQPKFSD